MCKASIDKKAENIMPADPFAVLDREGVGTMMKWAIQEGRKTRPNIKLGICGEHGGEPNSVTFCHELGLNYVSCSPYRVPIARLAAAQAAVAVLETKESERKSRKPPKKTASGRTTPQKKSSKTKVVKKKAALKKKVSEKKKSAKQEEICQSVPACILHQPTSLVHSQHIPTSREIHLKYMC